MAEIISTGCPHDCGGRCILKVHVQEGKMINITTVRDPELRACIRGLYSHERFNSVDRLKYPLKRTGEKGEDTFERISWNEALGIIVDEMKRIKSSYGNSAFLLHNLAGDMGQLYGTKGGAADRFFNMLGGCTKLWGSPTCEGLRFASQYTFGSLFDANEVDDLLNSRMIILWGFNPIDTVQGTGTYSYIAQAKKAG
mgnify:CR=1 FL=1